MIPAEGLAIAGLDEFMLRTGHLKVLAKAAVDTGGSWKRITREAANTLNKPVTVDLFADNSALAEYLYRKRLCNVKPQGGDYDHKVVDKLRYPDLFVAQTGPASFVLEHFDSDDSSPTISWQDHCLSHPDIRSTVGAITTSAKSSSKTGISHICDWAISLSLIAKNGQAMPLAQLLSSIYSESERSNSDWNPYVPGPEMIIIAHCYFGQDFDLFARLAPLIVGCPQPIRRADATHLFTSALKTLVEDASSSNQMSSGSQYRLAHQLRDLEKAAKRLRKEVDATSTAWHRAASRFETFVDLGLLDKSTENNSDKFKYVYFANQSLLSVPDSLTASTSPNSWIDQHLVRTLFGPHEEGFDVSDNELIESLANSLARISLPVRLLPIDVVVLLLAYESLRTRKPVSLGAVRQRIISIARTRSDIFRLSRGTRGESAEFVSIRI